MAKHTRKPSAPPVYCLSGEVPAWPPPDVYWLTADSDFEDGQIMDFVEVWVERPHRHTNHGWLDTRGAFWLSKPEEECWDVSTRYGRYTRSSMLRWLGTVPDDDAQLVKVG